MRSDQVLPPRLRKVIAEMQLPPVMDCQELAHRIQHLHPQASVRDVARLCLLLANATDGLEGLNDQRSLEEAWREVTLRVKATRDQHAAMTDELNRLARSDPRKFTAEQIWVLIRAIKVQSQILQLYIGDEALTV